MKQFAPETSQVGEGRTFVLPELQGALLGYAPLGLVMAYRYSFHCQTQGERQGALCHAGVIVAKAKATGWHIGCAWSWFADDLRVISQ